MTTTLSYLDSYCERAGSAALFAEPLNAATNLFFIAAALGGLYLILRLPTEPLRRRIDFYLLTAALFAIGIGSGFWHLMPSGKTVLMDVIPITIFIHIYLISAMRRLLLFSWPRVLLWWLFYCAATVLAQLTLPPGLWNGSVMYFPTYLALLLLTVAIFRRSRQRGRIFLGLVLLWTLSLLFRTFDHAVCPHVTIGTHFLWHTLNAWMLYRLLVALIDSRGSPPTPAL